MRRRLQTPDAPWRSPYRVAARPSTTFDSRQSESGHVRSASTRYSIAPMASGPSGRKWAARAISLGAMAALASGGGVGERAELGGPGGRRGALQAGSGSHGERAAGRGMPEARREPAPRPGDGHAPQPRHLLRAQRAARQRLGDLQGGGDRRAEQRPGRARAARTTQGRGARAEAADAHHRGPGVVGPGRPADPARRRGHRPARVGGAHPGRSGRALRRRHGRRTKGVERAGRGGGCRRAGLRRGATPAALAEGPQEAIVASRPAPRR